MQLFIEFFSITCFNQMTDYTVHIVSERLMFRKTFSKLLSVLDSTVISREHAQGCAELTDLPAAPDGAVLLDCGTQSVDDVINQLLQVLSVQPAVTLVMVLDEQHDETIDAGMTLGVMGVIIKASPPQVIIDSLQRILGGERCRPAPAVAISREEIPESMRQQLSARQQKMLRAIMGGQSISSTAKALSITPAKLVNEMRQVMATIRGRVF